MSEAVRVGENGAVELTLPGRMLLRDLVGDGEMAERVIQHGRISSGKSRDLIFKLKKLENGEHEVLALGAVTRDPGAPSTFLSALSNYQRNTGSRVAAVDLYWNVYKNNGLVNNATNTVAAILAASSTFKVRHARRGKARRPEEEYLAVLQWWQRNVNNNGVDAVVSGARGHMALQHEAARYALVEGSWIGRSAWLPAEVGRLGSFELPMVVQTITTAQIEVVTDVSDTGLELFFWRPPAKLINLLSLSNPQKEQKVVQRMVKRFLPRDYVRSLIQDSKVLLDPALLMHVKNRSTAGSEFGESFIQPALSAIAFAEAVSRLDQVSMQNLVNRLTIIMVGGDKDSPYGSPDAIQSRTQLMQELMEETGPNMTIVWAGNDVKVVDVGAHNAVLDLEGRFELADAKIKQALGVPDALLSGITSDGRAAGWASIIAASIKVGELANQFSQCWTTMAERVGLSNDFREIDVIHTWDTNHLFDQVELRSQNRNDYVIGLLSIRSMLLAMGKDPEAEFHQRCKERGLNPDTVTWETAFAPVQGLQGQGDGKVPGNGRTPDRDTDNTERERELERRSVVENQ